MSKNNERKANSRELPEDLVIEILARLPVKTLIKFTCVSKFWLSLVKSHNFAIKQYATRSNPLSQHSNSYECQFFLTYSPYYNPVGNIDIISYESLESSSVFCTHSFRRDWIHRTILGPCNGIFCLCFALRYNEDVHLLWNPSTREVFQMANPEVRIDKPKTCFGFGFDGDYKVIGFDSSRFRWISTYRLYSLATDSWKYIDDSVYRNDNLHVHTESPSSSNGSMCSWLATRSTRSSETILLSFNFVDETFIETPIPDSVLKNRWSLFLQQRSHLLFPTLICYGLENKDTGWPRTGCVNVWVLNGYGPTGCWTNQVSATVPDHIVIYEPIGLWKNNEILYTGEIRVSGRSRKSVIALYNAAIQKVKCTETPEDCQLMEFTESLFSINSLSRHGSNNKKPYGVFGHNFLREGKRIESQETKEAEESEVVEGEGGW